MDQAVLREDEDSQAPWWQAPQSQVRNLAHYRCWKFIKELLAKGAHVRASRLHDFESEDSFCQIRVGTTCGPVQGS
jgi:hypothetical protein